MQKNGTQKTGGDEGTTGRLAPGNMAGMGAGQDGVDGGGEGQATPSARERKAVAT